MECAERGLIDAPWLRFGDAGALLRALDEIGERRGLGELLAEGSRRAAERVGGGSAAFAPHVKGMEMPGYEPRTLQAMALGLAVNARGADHNRSGAYEADLSGDHDRLAGGEAHVAAAIETEDRAAVMDSLILCKFLRGVFTDPFDRVGGAAVRGDRLGRGRRRAAATPPAGSCWPSGCSTSARAGGRRTTGCPERLLAEPLQLGSGRVAALTAGAAARHDRRLLCGAWARRAGPAGPGSLADLRLDYVAAR